MNFEAPVGAGGGGPVVIVLIYTVWSFVDSFGINRKYFRMNFGEIVFLRIKFYFQRKCYRLYYIVDPSHPQLMTRVKW